MPRYNDYMATTMPIGITTTTTTDSTTTVSITTDQVTTSDVDSTTMVTRHYHIYSH